MSALGTTSSTSLVWATFSAMTTTILMQLSLSLSVAYLMRWPVLRLIWLKLTFSVSEVAGYNATGQVTSERRKKPFQLARGAMRYSENATTTGKDNTGEPGFKRAGRGFCQRR